MLTLWGKVYFIGSSFWKIYEVRSERRDFNWFRFWALRYVHRCCDSICQLYFYAYEFYCCVLLHFSHPERVVERSTVIVLQGSFKDTYGSYALPLIEGTKTSVSSTYLQLRGLKRYHAVSFKVSRTPQIKVAWDRVDAGLPDILTFRRPCLYQKVPLFTCKLSFLISLSKSYKKY